MLVIGLTGGIGSGKSTVAHLFSEKGVEVIDTDQLARDVTQPGKEALKKIVEKFGAEILLPDGSLNRTALRHKIFAQAEDRVWLEKLLHPLIRNEMKHLADTSHAVYCIVVIPLLFETEPNPLINRVLVVDAPETAQIERVQSRDKSSQEQVQTIINTQISRDQRLAKANDIIYNHGDINELTHQVEELHRFYLLLAESS